MKKTSDIIVTALIWVLLAVSAFMTVFALLAARTFDQPDRRLFGYNAFIAEADAEGGTEYDAGDLLLSEKTDPRTLSEGDIILFYLQNGDIRAGKIRTLTGDEDGNPVFLTCGADDSTVVTYGQIIGKYSHSLSGVGAFFRFIRSSVGYFLCILLPFALLIVILAVKLASLLRRYKEEQLESIRAEREQLAAACEESRLMREAEEENIRPQKRTVPMGKDYQPSEEEIQAYLASQAAIRAAAERKLAEMKSGGSAEKENSTEN